MNVIGPIPQMAMTAGSVPLALTPSWCGVRATRRTKVPAVPTLCPSALNLSPLATHQAPETTTQ